METVKILRYGQFLASHKEEIGQGRIAPLALAVYTFQQFQNSGGARLLAILGLKRSKSLDW